MSESFLLEVETLRQLIILGQPLYEHFFHLGSFLAEVVNQRNNHLNYSNVTENLVNAEFNIICCLQKLQQFHKVHLSTFLTLELDKEDCNIEEKLKRHDNNVLPAQGSTRRNIYMYAKEARSLINHERLSHILTKEILLCIKLCTELKDYIPGFDVFGAALQCKASIEVINYSKEYRRQVKKCLKILTEYSEQMTPDNKRKVENLWKRYEKSRKNSKNEEYVILDSLICVLDGVILEHTFLPSFQEYRLDIKGKMYQGTSCFIGDLLVKKETNDVQPVFVNPIEQNEFLQLSSFTRANFLYFLKVLSQAEHRDCSVSSLIGFVKSDGNIFLLFESFECTFFDVVNEKHHRDLGDCLNILSDITVGLNFLHDRNICHGSVIPHNIFLSTSQETGRVRAKLGYIDLFKTFQKVQERDEPNFSGICFLQTSWRNLVCIPPELFRFKKTISTTVDDEEEVVGYNKSCDIYSLGICIYLCMTPLFASTVTNKDKRLEAITKYKYPYCHAMHIVKIEFERNYNVNFSNLKSSDVAMFEKKITRRFIDLVFDNDLRPSIPTELDSSVSATNNVVKHIIFICRSLWTKNAFERPTASMLKTSLDDFMGTINNINEIDFQGVSLATVKIKVHYKNPDGLVFGQLFEALSEYFYKWNPNIMQQLYSLVLSFAMGLSLEQLSEELEIAYGTPLKVDDILKSYENVFYIPFQRKKKPVMGHKRSTSMMEVIPMKKVPPSPPPRPSRSLKSSTFTCIQTQDQQMLVVDEQDDDKTSVRFSDITTDMLVPASKVLSRCPSHKLRTSLSIAFSAFKRNDVTTEELEAVI